MLIVRAVFVQLFLMVVFTKGMDMSWPWAHLASFLGSTALALTIDIQNNTPQPRSNPTNDQHSRR